jgi:hypothetical protein
MMTLLLMIQPFCTPTEIGCGSLKVEIAQQTTASFTSGSPKRRETNSIVVYRNHEFVLEAHWKIKMQICL